MTPTYTAKLGFTTQKTSIKAQNINGLALEIYGMLLTKFSIQDSLRKVQFFKKTFLLTNTNIELILGIPFLFLNNIDIEFAKPRKLTWKSYTIAKILFITNWIQLINKKKFAKTVLDRNFKTFVIYISILEPIQDIHPFQAAQIAAL